ncbi:MAG TPA: hypothetical protein VLV84_04965, partial [Candidatus Acidoferrales bacterium]|nr:hypothetical protein [Candidatus Acidoferrales bacterium]
MQFDILMPSILFFVTLAAMFLGRKAEPKLKSTVEEREFRTRDVVLLVAILAFAISIIVFIPGLALVALFLFSYSSLLFTVSYAFSGFKTYRMELFCVGFIVAGILAGVAGVTGVMPMELKIYGVSAFTIFAVLSFCALLYAHGKPEAKLKWYLAALPPILFVLLYIFFGTTFLWLPYLLDAYGITFAMLIVIYLGSLFNWKTVFVFAGLITALDIVLVWGPSQVMITTAQTVASYGLPVLVTFPTIPLAYATAQGVTYIQFLSLGLGDFFFAGVLSTQTMKQFGKKTAIISLFTICISFALFELLLLNPNLAAILP